ncbi:MAG TPA: DUF2723 domain-containing protein [Verrucomicrobiae bacterium]
MESFPEPGDPPIPPLYRAVDYWTFAVSSLLIFIGCLLTLSPDVTLADSGELAAAARWAAVPNPPGHPVWTVLTWLFIKLVPVSTIAGRAALASALEAALACGLVAMMVSRASNLIIGGVASLKNIEPRQQEAIGGVAGFVAGISLGFNGVVWSQAVIVQTCALSMLLLVLTLAFILRWVYAANQRRCIYWAAYLFGLSVTGHQLLIVAAMGFEIAAAICMLSPATEALWMTRKRKRHFQKRAVRLALASISGGHARPIPAIRSNGRALTRRPNLLSNKPLPSVRTVPRRSSILWIFCLTKIRGGSMTPFCSWKPATNSTPATTSSPIG